MRKSILLLASACSSVVLAQKPTNVIIVLTDDQGYQDLGCFGSPLINTPNIDRMSSEGMRLTDFYSAASISSPSRAGLLTGQFNTRNGVKFVLFPGEKGMPANKITIAEALKERGYATACFGKWHLGDAKGHMPTDQGFDEYFGIPYSNDMYIGPKQEFSSEVVLRGNYTMEKALEDQKFVASTKNRNDITAKLRGVCPLFRDDKIIEYPCDLSTTTNRYFDYAINFIGKNKNNPFFIYLTPQMPHVPLYVSEQFKGKSKRGLYGDAVEEIDWNMGRLLKYLDDNGLAENTLVIFTSDNGPWLKCKEDGGSADPLRDGKFSYYEGGVRVPCIMQWKGHIPAGTVSNAIISSVDLFPTIMKISGGDAKDYDLDGKDISEFLYNPNTKLLDEYVYVKYGRIAGVRKGDWIYLPDTGKKKKEEKDSPELFNIKEDISQKDNVYTKYSDKIVELDNIMKYYINKTK